MAFYRDQVYPHIVQALGNPKPIDDIRRRLVPLAQGNVLELGVGPGVNFPYYHPDKVSKIFALEPNPGMLRRADEERRRPSSKPNTGDFGPAMLSRAKPRSRFLSIQK